MLFAGFNVADGEYSLFMATFVGVAANVVGSWIAYAIGYFGRVDLIEKHGRKVFIKPHHLQVGRQLVREVRRRDRVLLAHAADHPHVHLAARGRREDAVLALHDPDRARVHPVGVHARVHRQAGRRPLGELEGQPALHRLRGASRRSCSARSGCSCATGGGAAATRPPRMPPPPESLQVAALGLIQGAAELLPVSSSAHVAAVPRLLGWEVAAWPPARRKELEVALHAGALVALAPALWRLRPDARDARAVARAARGRSATCSSGRSRSASAGRSGLACGLLLGAAALAAADRGAGGRRGRARARRARRTGALGAQRVAPARGRADRGARRSGSRRRGARRPACRGPARRSPRRGRSGYSRAEASRLSFGVAGPVLAGRDGAEGVARAAVDADRRARRHRRRAARSSARASRCASSASSGASRCGRTPRSAALSRAPSSAVRYRRAR